MKNIRSIALSSFCLCMAICTQAQVETKKPAANPIPQVSVPPLQAPEMPNAPKKVINSDAVTETPSPLTRDKNQEKPEKQKPVMKVIDGSETVTSPGGEESRNIMLGKTTRPSPAMSYPSTIDPKAAPQQVKPARPVNGQQQRVTIDH